MGVKVVDRDPSLGGLTHAHKVLLHLLLQLLRQGVGRLTAHRQVTTQPGFLHRINIMVNKGGKAVLRIRIRDPVPF
jgi:hypothetical protein